MRPFTDGHSTTIALANLPEAWMHEKDVTPFGFDMGGPIETTSMRNSIWKTWAARTLKNLAPVSATVAFSFTSLRRIQAQMGVNQEITIGFPDGSSVVFWGWIESFTPDKFTEGEQPTAEVKIQPASRNTSGNEVSPVYNGAPVSLIQTISLIGNFLFKTEPGAFKVTITNVSADSPAQDMFVTIVLPDEFTFVSCNYDTEVDDNTVVVGVGTLEVDPENPAEITVTVIPSAAGFYTVQVPTLSIDVANHIDYGTSTFDDQEEFRVFDRTTCAVDVDVPSFDDAGGDTFDCYPVGEIVDQLVQGDPVIGMLGGTGFPSNWVVTMPFGWLLGEGETGGIWDDDGAWRDDAVWQDEP